MLIQCKVPLFSMLGVQPSILKSAHQNAQALVIWYLVLSIILISQTLDGLVRFIQFDLGS